MIRKALVSAFLAASFIYAGAQESPLWLRKNRISPDGEKIAFSYKGDIYVVSSNGGDAMQITSNDAYDSDPIWTKDSKSIVFSSYREGEKDIFITSANGGVPKRITDIAGNETPLAVLKDGRIIYSTSIQPNATYSGFPGTAQIYIIGQDGGRPKMVSPMTVSDISVSDDGTVLYEDYKGYEDPLRKHHTSSVTRDIWMYKGNNSEKEFKIDGKGTFTKLSTYEGEDRQPFFAADGKTFYYLSEQNGKSFNIYKSSIDQPGKSVQITFHEKNPVRFISVSDNGKIAYSYNGELYTVKDGKSEKLSINVIRDESEKELSKMTLASGATSMAVSPNGKEIAIVARGDVFVTSIDYSTTKRITNTPEQERNVSFSKDGRELYYSAERNGNWGIYRTVLTEKDDKYFTYALKTKEELFSDPGQTCFQPQVSPDGKMVAYLRDRTEVVVKPVKGGEAKSLLKGTNYSYSDGDMDFAWSPDSQYILSTYQADGAWNNADVALLEVETGKVTNLTESGYSDGAFRWALGGKAMTWQSDKNGYRSHGSWGAETDIYIMFFDGKKMTEFRRDKESDDIVKLLSDDKSAKEEKKDSLDKEKGKVEKVNLELEGRDARIVRLTGSSANYGDYYLTDDGSTLYYITPLESGSGLCTMDIKGGDIKVIRRDVRGSIIPSPDGKNIYLFAGNSIVQIAVGSNQTKNISYNGEFEFKPKAEREYIFNHIWKQVSEKFYDPNLHGTDWNYCRENYSKFLPYINNDFDFQDMLSEMLGELNGSHTGARYYWRKGETLGYLGVIYDYDYTGDGLKIKEVLPGGVLSLADSEIKAGDVIEAIDGNAIKAGESWYPYLSGKAGKRVAISISKGGKKAIDLYVVPASSDSDLLYRRWVRQREDLVAKLSGGKIGYVHVKGMDSPSFREVFSKALGKYRTCDALIVDTRHNGGGWLHENLAVFLSGKSYVNYVPRGQYIGTEPYDRWDKPSCVLVGEDNYSDASGFPYAYQELGLGKLIGAPIPGTMTAVWWETQINQNIVFGIPEVGNFGIEDGYFIENHQITPDIVVYNDPASELNGEDKQLEAAVKEMLKETEK